MNIKIHEVKEEGDDDETMVVWFVTADVFILGKTKGKSYMSVALQHNSKDNDNSYKIKLTHSVPANLSETLTFQTSVNDTILQNTWNTDLQPKLHQWAQTGTLTEPGSVTTIYHFTKLNVTEVLHRNLVPEFNKPPRFSMLHRDRTQIKSSEAAKHVDLIAYWTIDNHILKKSLLVQLHEDKHSPNSYEVFLYDIMYESQSRKL
jgi:hypothetical protein